LEKKLITCEVGFIRSNILFFKELQSYYFSYNRDLEKEKKLLKEIDFKIKQVVDIYPKEYNRWDNTHFYAIVCERK